MLRFSAAMRLTTFPAAGRSHHFDDDVCPCRSFELLERRVVMTRKLRKRVFHYLASGVGGGCGKAGIMPFIQRPPVSRSHRLKPPV
jgi:hypothetical protein